MRDRVHVRRTEKMIMFQIRDSGPGFSLDSIEHAAISNPPEEPLRHTHYRDAMGLRPGGSGIMLVRKIADELIYSEAGNEVNAGEVFMSYLPPFKY